jgi:hypothetical protein
MDDSPVNTLAGEGGEEGDVRDVQNVQQRRGKVPHKALHKSLPCVKKQIAIAFFQQGNRMGV